MKSTLKCFLIKDATESCPETSVRNYHY